MVTCLILRSVHRCRQSHRQFNGMFTLANNKTERETEFFEFYWIVWRCSYCSETETNANFHWLVYTFYWYRIVWRYSYCPEAETTANFHWLLYIFYWYLYRSRAVWMNRSIGSMVIAGFPLGLENLEKWEGIFQSGNFEQTGKVRENHTKYWKTQGIWDKYYLIFLYIIFSDI